MTTVLFVCVQNSCRSQMAEGFARSLGAGVINPYSAGSRPFGMVNPTAVKVMGEKGIDISRQGSKGFADLTVKQVDYLVTMGCKDACPVFPAVKQLDWNLDDPAGKPVEEFRKVRGEIEQKVSALIEEIKRSGSEAPAFDLHM
ncbi:MAG: arsenate reductase ArsC [Candidatus Edwardsbacteria bacterium]|nr:arsenate reductase ArsC [Candidatus Edwardsbacteria bacterium]